MSTWFIYYFTLTDYLHPLACLFVAISPQAVSVSSFSLVFFCGSAPDKKFWNLGKRHPEFCKYCIVFELLQPCDIMGYWQALRSVQISAVMYSSQCLLLIISAAMYVDLLDDTSLSHSHYLFAQWNLQCALKRGWDKMDYAAFCCHQCKTRNTQVIRVCSAKKLCCSTRMHAIHGVVVLSNICSATHSRRSCLVPMSRTCGHLRPPSFSHTFSLLPSSSQKEWCASATLTAHAFPYFSDRRWRCVRRERHEWISLLALAEALLSPWFG